MFRCVTAILVPSLVDFAAGTIVSVTVGFKKCHVLHEPNPCFIQIPVENTKTQGTDGEDDPTFCEVCGRSDREDRLLLCDGCDAG